MTSYERLALGFFVVLVVAAPFTKATPRSKWQAAIVSTVLGACVLAASAFLPSSVRAWLPHVWLVAAYRIPALLASGPTAAFEAWLLRSDEAWRRFILQGPAWVLHVLELSYLLCYPLVPFAFIVVWVLGTDRDVERFWLSVLGAGFACYITLIAVVSRTPRLIAITHLRTSLASLNTRVLAVASHSLNTFPSGHVAVTTAAALTVFPVSPVAGVFLGIMAASIATAAFVGRYHFGIDVMLGALVGVLAALVSFIV